MTTVAMAKSMALEQFQWKNRILLVHPGTADSASVESEIEDSLDEIQERDLVYFILAETPRTNAPGHLEADTAQRLASEYRLHGDGLTAVLIGKDGTEKLRMRDALDLDRIFRVIDAMPMRKREMRER